MSLRFLALALCLIAGAAQAAAPTLVASGDSTPGFVNTNYSVSVGTPAASNLVVVAMVCADNTASAVPAMTAPSGWTRELDRSSSDTFTEHSLFWKVASGSEGASVNFPISNAANFNCGARYWKFTGYDTTNPIDATDIAFSSSSTQDPPSQTVATGPLDVYVIAFASTRGDASYSSGSDLTTNAHSDAGGLNSGKSTAVSYGSYSSISSKDPGAFTFSAARMGSAITAVIYPTAASGAFDTSPSVTSHTTTAYTVGGSLTGAGTVKAVACNAGSTAPTIAEINAAHCTGGSAPNASGNQSPSMAPFDFSFTLTPSQSPAYPIYDLYVTDGTTRVALTTSFLTAPSTCGANSDQACQFVQLTSVAIGGIASIATLGYDAQTQNFVVGDTITGGTSGAVGQVISDSDSGATGTLTLWISSGTFSDNEALAGSIRGAATVNGTASFLYAANDVLVAPTYVSPGGSGVALTIDPDGNASYISGGELETALNIKVYDYSAIGYASGDIDLVNNDSAPSCVTSAARVTATYNVAFSYYLGNVCSDPEGGSITSTAFGSLPTGLSHSSSTNITSGTPTVVNSLGTAIQYVIADSYNALTSITVTYPVVAAFTAPDCVSSLTLETDCETAFTAASSSTATFALTTRCSASIPSGYVVTTSPRAGAYLQSPAAIGIAYSVGACGAPTPMVKCLGLTPTACQTAVTAAFGSSVTVSSVSACPSVGSYSNGHIYSQTPAPGRPIRSSATLTVTYCP